jgi:hypothetical protein
MKSVKQCAWPQLIKGVLITTFHFSSENSHLSLPTYPSDMTCALRALCLCEIIQQYKQTSSMPDDDMCCNTWFLMTVIPVVCITHFLSTSTISEREIISLQHVNNMSHLRPLLGIRINTAECNKNSPFQSPCCWLHFHLWICNFF